MPEMSPDPLEPGDVAREHAQAAALEGFWSEPTLGRDPRLPLSTNELPVFESRRFSDFAILRILDHIRRGSSAQGMHSGTIGSQPESRGTDATPRSEQRSEASGDEHDASASGCLTEACASPLRRVGKYLVVEHVDCGGQAEVYRVLHPGLANQYILKLSRRPLVTHPTAEGEVIDGLVREARLLCRCDHPNLVRIIDLDLYNGRPFVVMEEVTGPTLQEYAAHRRPGARQAAQIVAELARAVAYLHKRYIIHQDITPRNVIVDENGRPRLIDFGLAQLRNAASRDTAEWTGGTAGYMSPEQALGIAERIRPQTDIFGLGGVLYYLLTDRPVYHGASAESVIRQAREVGFVPPRQINPSVPRSLERICQRALAANQDHRYQSARELERALRRTLHRPYVVLAATIATLVAAAAIALYESAARAPARIQWLEVTHFRGEHAESLGPVDLHPRSIFVDDDVKLSAHLESAAHCWLIALNTDGGVQLCTPVDESRELRRVIGFEFPADPERYFGLTDGPGLQAFVLIGSRRPIARFSDWRAGLSERWRPSMGEIAWRYRERRLTPVLGSERGEVRSRERPPTLVAACEYLAALPGVETIEAIAFPVRPSPSNQGAAHVSDLSKTSSRSP